MARITATEAQAWGEKTKLRPALTSLDDALVDQIETETLSKLASVADTSTWVSSATTPAIVKTVICRLYVAWIIDRQYSEEVDLNAYAGILRTGAQGLIDGILDSSIDIPGAVVNADGLPSVYPDDCVEGPYFTMDAVF